MSLYQHLKIATNVSVIPPGQKCSSEIGMQGGQQVLFMNDECFRNGLMIPVHELLHTAGFVHEHTRNHFCQQCQWQTFLAVKAFQFVRVTCDKTYGFLTIVEDPLQPIIKIQTAVLCSKHCLKSSQSKISIGCRGLCVLCNLSNKTSQELRMLSSSLFIQGSQYNC